MAELSKEDLIKAFRRATSSFENAPRRWRERAAAGLTDQQLADALKMELGTFGGECGGCVGWLEFQGDGLKIWARHCPVNRHGTPPTLQGAATLRMAREVYGIPDPDERQMALF